MLVGVVKTQELIDGCGVSGCIAQVIFTNYITPGCTLTDAEIAVSGRGDLDSGSENAEIFVDDVQVDFICQSGDGCSQCPGLGVFEGEEIYNVAASASDNSLKVECDFAGGVGVFCAGSADPECKVVLTWTETCVNATTTTTIVTTTTTTTTTCTCTAYTDAGCGLGGCGTNVMLQTRACNPSSCDAEFQCVASPSCIATTTTLAPTTTTTLALTTTTLLVTTTTIAGAIPPPEAVPGKPADRPEEEVPEEERRLLLDILLELLETLGEEATDLRDEIIKTIREIEFI